MDSLFIIEISLATAANILAGFAWHSVFFARSGRQETYNKHEALLFEILSSAVTSYVFLMIIQYTGISSHALALLLWIGIVLPVYLSRIFYGGKVFVDITNEALYRLFSLLVIASIFALV